MFDAPSRPLAIAYRAKGQLPHELSGDRDPRVGSRARQRRLQPGEPGRSQLPAQAVGHVKRGKEQVPLQGRAVLHNGHHQRLGQPRVIAAHQVLVAGHEPLLAVHEAAAEHAEDVVNGGEFEHLAKGLGRVLVQNQRQLGLAQGFCGRVAVRHGDPVDLPGDGIGFGAEVGNNFLWRPRDREGQVIAGRRERIGYCEIALM